MTAKRAAVAVWQDPIERRLWAEGELCKVRFLRIAAIGGSRSIRHRCGLVLKGSFREIDLRALRLQQRTL
jgi:hypothetical protein